MPDWDATQEYVRTVFGAQERAMEELMPRAVRAGLPAISVDASVGRLLALLCSMTNGGKGAALALELGTLAGYSAIWIARGLQKSPPGRLITLEPEAAHAEFAEQAIAEAGCADRVRVRRAPALEEIPRLRREFGDESLDFVFVDAVKTEYLDYFRALRPMLRRGGLFVADNVLGAGWWITDAPGTDGSRDAVDGFNRAVAADEEFQTVCVPLREGLLVARRREGARR